MADDGIGNFNMTWIDHDLDLNVLATGPMVFWIPSLSVATIALASISVALFCPLRIEKMWDPTQLKYIRVRKRIGKLVIWFRLNVLFTMWVSYLDLGTSVLVALVFFEHGQLSWFAACAVFMAIPSVMMIAFDLSAPVEQSKMCNSRLVWATLDLLRLRLFWETMYSLRSTERAEGRVSCSHSLSLSYTPPLILAADFFSSSKSNPKAAHTMTLASSSPTVPILLLCSHPPLLHIDGLACRRKDDEHCASLWQFTASMPSTHMAPAHLERWELGT